MVATFVFSESNGAGPTVTDSISNINYGNTDAANITPLNNPVRAGENSYFKMNRGKWTGTFNKISAIKWWRSDGAGMPTGVSIVADTQTSYTQPTQTSIGTTAMPTTEGTALAPGPTELTSAGYSNYIRSQLKTETSASPGNTPTFTFTCQWDEQ